MWEREVGGRRWTTCSRANPPDMIPLTSGTAQPAPWARYAPAENTFPTDSASGRFNYARSHRNTVLCVLVSVLWGLVVRGGGGSET